MTKDSDGDDNGRGEDARDQRARDEQPRDQHVRDEQARDQHVRDEQARDQHARDEVADAIRARQSFAGDSQPGDEDLSSQGLTSGLRFGGTDDPLSEEEQALDDDDVELDREEE